jgi:superfamily II DNA or RNA helicase
MEVFNEPLPLDSLGNQGHSPYTNGSLGEGSERCDDMIYTLRGCMVDGELVTEEHISELTVVITPSMMFPNQKKKEFKVFETINFGSEIVYYIIPRYWASTKFGSLQFLTNSQEQLSRLQFEGCLGAVQKDAAEKCIKQINSEGGGVLSMPTGMGKTVIALYIACRLQVKTIVIVHKQILMNQWINRIEQFIPDARIGSIQQSRVNTVQCDILVGMLQSISMHEYDVDLFDDIGFAIFDEVHVSPTPVFSRALLKLQHIPNLLGLSATPERRDGLSEVFHWFLGPTCFECKLQDRTDVIVRVAYFTPLLLMYKPKNHRERAARRALEGKRDMHINLPVIITLLTKMGQRNALIVEHVVTLVTQDYRVMILSDRRDHCAVIQEMLCKHNIDSGLYIGGMKQSDLDVSTHCSVLLTTYPMAKEGLDLPEFDALVLGTPRSDVVQACGRVLHSKTPKNAIIVDIVDDWFIGNAQYNKRKQYYSNSGFIVAAAFPPKGF